MWPMRMGQVGPQMTSMKKLGKPRKWHGLWQEKKWVVFGFSCFCLECVGIVQAYVYLSGKEKVQIFDRVYGCGTAQFGEILSIAQKLTQFTIHTILSKVLSFTVHDKKMFGTFWTLFMSFISKNTFVFSLVKQLPQAVVKSIELQGFLCSFVWSWLSVVDLDSVIKRHILHCKLFAVLCQVVS